MARSSRGEVPLRVGVVAALAVDAFVHLQLAPQIQLAAPGGIGGGTLFRLQAGAAVIAALLLLFRPSRLTYLLAGLALVSALGAVLLYSFFNVPAIGPIPSMYDPQWYPLKTISAVAEGIGVVLAALGTVAVRPRVPAIVT